VDCHTSAQCGVETKVVVVAFFGGWAALVVGALSRSEAVAAVGLVVALACSMAVPAYGHFRDGFSGTTAEGRERRHEQARARIKEVVDGTVAAVVPGRTVRVELASGERDPNDTDTCEREIYEVTFPFTTAEKASIADRVVAHWRDLGFAVHQGYSVGAESGDLEFSLFLTDPRGRAQMYGAGPCLAK